MSDGAPPDSPARHRNPWTNLHIDDVRPTGNHRPAACWPWNEEGTPLGLGPTALVREIGLGAAAGICARGIQGKDCHATEGRNKLLHLILPFPFVGPTG